MSNRLKDFVCIYFSSNTNLSTSQIKFLVENKSNLNVMKHYTFNDTIKQHNLNKTQNKCLTKKRFFLLMQKKTPFNDTTV